MSGRRTSVAAASSDKPTGDWGEIGESEFEDEESTSTLNRGLAVIARKGANKGQGVPGEACRHLVQDSWELSTQLSGRRPIEIPDHPLDSGGRHQEHRPTRSGHDVVERGPATNQIDPLLYFTP